MKNNLHTLVSLIALTACFTLTGCFKNFYTVKTNTSYESLRTEMSDQTKEVIVHFTDETVALQTSEFDSNQVTGSMARYFPAKPQYAEPIENKRLHPYKYKHRDVLFKEVHVYATIPKPANTATTLKKEQISKYNIYKPARGASIGSHVLGGVLIATTIGLISVAFAASLDFALGSMAMGF